MVAFCRLLVVAVTFVAVLGTGCGDGERTAAEEACAAVMPGAHPEIRDGYFHMDGSLDMNGGGHSFTQLHPSDDRTAEQVFIDTCVASRLNPG